MKNIYTLLLILLPFAGTFSQIEGTWKVAPIAQALAVGPAMGDFSWWSNSAGDVTTRACFFDDEYVFNADGSFQNVLGAETWLEPWQGVDPESCGAPIAPHDGSNAATWTYDDVAGTITLDGQGAYLGLQKVINGGELANPADAPASITYPVVLSADGNTMTIDINFGPGYWHFVLEKEVDSNVGVEGTWKVAPIEQALAVGPAMGDFSWWSNSAGDVTTRACFFDDEFVFNADGSFQNVLGAETWLEPWQGVDPEGCGAPIAPHDGSNAATWTYDEGAGTITLDGQGAYLGLQKVINGGELANPADAPASITYPVVLSADGNTMTIDINFGPGYWHFVLERDVASNVVEPQPKLFSFFPNPASNMVQVNSDQVNDELILRDLTGRIIMNIQKPSQTEMLDVSTLPRGMYLLEVRAGEAISIEKLSIQ